MIRAVIYRNEKHQICGFKLSGHAGFAEEGQDIVCAAVTVLVLNTVNAIERFTKTKFECELDEKRGGFLYLRICDDDKSSEGHDVQLLLQTMVLGLEDITNEYSEYINLNNEEV